MTTISSGVGLVSGINYTQLITGLTAVDQSEINSVGARINNLSNQDTALTSLSTLVTSLKLSSASFISSSIFKATTANSANTSIIGATGGIGTPPGNYNFTVQQLASASQIVTQGFSNSTANLGLSGTITLQTGGGNVDGVAQLATLNGGAGVARGSIKITDRSGTSSTVDLSDAVSIQDVVNDINSSSGADVSASISDDHLVLTDTSGGTGSLSVANTGGTTTAANLGLTTASTGNTLTGNSLTALTSTTSLNSLNDGNGVRTSNGLNDFSVTAGGTTFNVQLSNTVKTVNDVVKAINTAGASAGVTAAISTDGTGLTLTAAGGGPISVTALNGSAASDLGLLGSSTTGTLVGDRVASALSGPLLRDLNGGDQINPSGTPPVASTLPQYGTISINGQSVDLSSARSLDDVISGINASNTGVTAAINSYGDGISLTSTSNTPFTVADGTGNLASYLKIAGTSTATATGSELDSNNLNLRYISTNTQLSTLNGGAGISKGSITLTDGSARSQVINLSGANINTVGDVINAINNSGMALHASINKAGNGIQIQQTGTGTGTASITESGGGSTASSLGILGTFSGGALNGSFQKSITIAPTDTLANIATKINDAGVGVAASIINDGSSGSPFRLSISSRNSGSAARLLFDGSAAGLTATSLVKGQDAVLIYGGSANGTGGLLSTSSDNTVTGLVPSLTLNLTGVGSTTVSVTSDTSQVATAVQTFVTNYNAVITNIANVTNFDATNNANIGILFGNSTVLQVQQALGQFANTNYNSSIGGSLSGLGSIGITVGTDGTLTLDSDALNSVLASDPTDVQNLFTKNVPAVAQDLTQNPPVQSSPAIEGIGATLSDLVTRFTDSSTGILFDASTAIESQETQLTTQQTLLTTLLKSKQSQLATTFANLETTLSGLQSQGTSISSISSTLSA
jgi:flagellar hook-associated protein 2